MRQVESVQDLRLVNNGMSQYCSNTVVHCSIPGGGSDLLMQSALDVSSFLFPPICLLSTWLSASLAAPTPIFPPTTPDSPLFLFLTCYTCCREKKTPALQKSVLGDEEKKRKRRKEISLIFTQSFTPSHYVTCYYVFSTTGLCLNLAHDELSHWFNFTIYY